MQALTPIARIAQLPAEVRHEADAWHQAFQSVTPPITEALRTVARRMGVSFSTTRKKYSEWKAHGYEAVINHSKLKRPEAHLSKDFIDWFRALAEGNQRKTRPAYRHFKKRWQNGEEIPGLDNSLPRHVLPAGCSYANLHRKVKDAFALEAMRFGLGRAKSKHGPKAFTTRVGLWPGSHYMFDDMWHDNLVVYRDQVVRVLEFDALDVFSGCKVGWGTKPRFKREDGKWDGLKESMMRMLVASLLWRHGYSQRGTVLRVEHGTAAIRDELEKLLHDHTGGLITVDRSEIIGREQAVSGMYDGQGGGNPRFKGALESMRNLYHNELAMLPGQTGKDRDHLPETTWGIQKASEDLIKAAEVLAKTHPQRVAHLQNPLLIYHGQFLPLLMDVYETINNRTWHDLEGWAECGHEVVEYRMSPDADQWLTPQTFQQLPAVSQQMLVQTAQADDRFLRRRKLSPSEVWDGGRQGLVRIEDWMVADILGQDMTVERKRKGCYFEFQDQELHPELLRYEARIRTRDGHDQELRDDKYLTLVNPFDLDQMFIMDARGRSLGVARRVQRSSMADVEGLQRQWAHNKERMSELLGPIKQRHAAMTRERTRMAEHNARVLDTNRPFTEEEKQEDQEIRTTGREVAERFLEAAPRETADLDEDSGREAAEALTAALNNTCRMEDNE